MATTDSLAQRINAFVRELAEELGDVEVGETDLSWLDAVETRAVEIGDAISAQLTQEGSRQQPLHDQAACPQCGKTGRYQRQRERELIGRRGPVTIHQPEYFCPCCRKAFFPADPSDRCGD